MKKIIQKGLEKLGALTTPNMIYAIDLEGEIGNNVVISRFTLEITKNNTFMIREFRFNTPHAFYPVTVLNYREIRNKSLADAKIEQLVTVKEQRGYSYINETRWPIVRLFDSLLVKNKFHVLSSYTANIDSLIQPTVQHISAGMRVIVKVNEFGDLIVNELNHLNDPDDHIKSITNPGLLCFVSSLKKAADFRGCIIEGFITDDRFYIVDAGYLIDTCLKEMDWDVRMKKIPELLKKVEMVSFGVEFVVPKKITSSASLTDGLFVIKDQKSKFAMYSSSYEEQIYLAPNYQHVESSHYDDQQRLVCTGIDDATIKIEFPHPLANLTQPFDEYYIVRNKEHTIVF